MEETKMAKEEKAIKLTPKSETVMVFLQANDGEFFGDEIAVALELNPKGIHGVMNGLVQKEFVGKTDKQSREVLDKEGKPVTREYVKYFLTDLGRDFPIAE
jgi:predicted transcriptional regulator